MAFEPWQDMAFLLGHVHVFLMSVLGFFFLFFFSHLFRRDSHCTGRGHLKAGLECVLAV